jgi:MerR family copper efflux transcriptional regulator
VAQHTIGEIARRVGIGVETVRFYEREGLVAPPPRSEAGYRLYPEEAVERLRFVRRAKELGFTLEQIRGLLQLRVGEGAACDAARGVAVARLEDVEARIADLRRIADALSRLITACEVQEGGSDCPILAALAPEVPRG